MGGGGHGFTPVFGRLGPLLRSRLELTIVSVLISIRRTRFDCLGRRAKTATNGLDIRVSGLGGTNCMRIVGAFGKGVPYAVYGVALGKLRTFRRCMSTLGDCVGVGAWRVVSLFIASAGLFRWVLFGVLVSGCSKACRPGVVV